LPGNQVCLVTTHKLL